MTLLAIEGMAQAAYYMAYGEFNGAGPSRPGPAAQDAAFAVEYGARPRGERIHPYYGFTSQGIDRDLNQFPPPQRQEGVVLIALTGGSVSRQVAPAFHKALETWFRRHDIPLWPVVLELGNGAWKQPQQVIIIAYMLSLGGEFDIIVNLDGHNELVNPHTNYFDFGVFPFYPHRWDNLMARRLPAEQKTLISRIYALRQRQERLDALASGPWRRLALYGIVNRYLQERATTQILTLNHELADAAPIGSNKALLGPVLNPAPDEYDLRQMALFVWQRSSLVLADLSRAHGAEYYHFQQPNQYIPDSKPLTDEELELYYHPEIGTIAAYRDGYPLLRRLGDELRQQGINYYDLTQIFADNRETLYNDGCCHLNWIGNEILAENMVQRLAPALRNRAALAQARVGVGKGSDMTAGAAPYPAAAQEVSPVQVVNKRYFDVLRTDEGNLRYSREACRTADTAAPFFAHITPEDAADLRPENAAAGYNRYEFGFDQNDGATDAAGQCVMEYELPGYDIAEVLTGQYIPGAEQILWQARIPFDVEFAVQRTAAGHLRYSKDQCLPVHTAGTNFFLHITPVHAADFHPGRAEHGYNNHDFRFRYNDTIVDADGRCVLERELPGYDIASIRTGQFVVNTGRRLWEANIGFE